VCAEKKNVYEDLMRVFGVSILDIPGVNAVEVMKVHGSANHANLNSGVIFSP